MFCFFTCSDILFFCSRCVEFTLVNSYFRVKPKYRSASIYCANKNWKSRRQSKGRPLTRGCLWQLNETHWQALDHYEGVREGCYRRSQLKVITEENKTGETVTAYLSNDESYGVPSKHYQSGVLQGAYQVGLPVHYISKLESWATGYSLESEK
jgi:gamma-glutamylcyclotransferase (GGCT)/AIG2-like uncharacterized protein YtfP